MKIAIGIDPSLTGSAVIAVGPDGAFGESKRFSSEPIMPGIGERCGPKPRIVRAHGLACDISAEVRKVSRQVDCICIEGYSFASNTKGAHERVEFGGILRLLLIEHAVPLYEVAPTALKKWVHGKGAGDKTAVIARMASEFGLQFATNDEYDAAALARIALQVAGLEEPQTQYRREVVDMIKNGKPVKAKKSRKTA